jgi:hypothetical protein
LRSGRLSMIACAGSRYVFGVIRALFKFALSLGFSCDRGATRVPAISRVGAEEERIRY